MPGLRWIHCPALPAKADALIEMKWCPLGLSLMHWKGAWLEVSPPYRLVDGLLKGPLATFVHEHCFEPEPSGGCWLEDRITLSFGEGVLAGLAGWLVCRLALPPLFAWRHWRTRAWAQKQKRAAPQDGNSAI